MATLEKIRKRSVLLIVIIGAALLAFILGDALTNGRTLFGNGTTVATPSNGGVLKLKKTDITIGRRGVYVTLELENGISAESVKWSTSDSSIATVYNGNVTALNKGTCVIRAEYNGQTAECVVRCKF